MIDSVELKIVGPAKSSEILASQLYLVSGLMDSSREREERP
jgi:hypothetical protein